ncbi:MULTISPECIES: heme ABC transporter ATP-binding protein [Luteimonas]|uniref:heme ABC transporter ATP-binding protein n=1 Tax=Luteimonas TaxID=83614 RepID=UPI000C7A7770|nr:MULTISPECIES: heme ABC transporter ATP-binding protein [Luteimonas]
MSTQAIDDVLAIDGVSVHIDGRAILDAVDLRFARGTLTALVGPNGAGKSTLLAVAAGDLAPHAGQVRLAGTDLRAWKARALARERGVLPQDHAVRFGFSVREVVAMGRLPHAPDPAADTRIVDAALTAADVVPLSDRDVQTLSGGEASRTAFARVLAQTTPVLFLDEPTAALDLHHQESVLREARRLADGGACVIVVLHDLNLAAGHADRIVILHGGRIAADGTPRDVLTRDLIERVYGQPVLVLEHPTRGVPLVVNDDPRD